MGKNIGRAIANVFKKAPSVITKIARRASTAVDKYAPIAQKVGSGLTTAGALTGQPELAAAGAGLTAGASAAQNINSAVRPIVFH
jgi:hypothetical protein